MDSPLRFSRNSESILAISLADMVRTLGRSSAVILLPIYFLTGRHASYIVIGAVIAVSYIATAPFSILGGSLADRIGRRPLFTLLPLVSFAVFLSMSIEIIFRMQLWLLLFTFVFTSPIGSLQGTVDSAVLSDLTAPQDRIKAFGLLRLFSNVGFALGPALGGLVASIGYGTLLLVPAAANLVEETVYFSFVRESMPSVPSEINASWTMKRGLVSFPAHDGPFMILVGVMVVASLCLGQWGTTLTLFLSGSYRLSAAQIGLMYSLNGLVVVLFQLPVNRMMSRFGDIERLAAGIGLYAVSFLMYGVLRDYVLILLTTAVLTIGENIYSPAASTAISKIAPQDRRGEYFGAYSAVNSFTSPLVVIFGSMMLTFFIRSPYLMWSVVSLIGAVSCALMLYSRQQIPRSRLD